MKPKKVQVGYLYKTDGSVEKVFPHNGKKFDYPELQGFVGGYYQSLIPGQRSELQYCRQMFCNEDGMRLNLPRNPWTWQVVKSEVYKLNGYSPLWRVLGNIIALVNEEIPEPAKESHGRATEAIRTTRANQNHLSSGRLQPRRESSNESSKAVGKSSTRRRDQKSAETVDGGCAAASRQVPEPATEPKEAE